MPRAKKPTAPNVRSDGEMTPGNLTAPGGQPNGRVPANAAVGVGDREPYGGESALQSDVANTPVPPGIDPVAHEAAKTNYIAKKRAELTPLFAPTQRPWEPVTAGAPRAPGPTNPLAVPVQGASGIGVANILQQAADASGSPALQALAERANAIAGAGVMAGPLSG